MKHDLPSRPRLALTAAVVVALGAGVTTAALLVGAADEPGETVGTQGISLVAYDTCDTALTELKDRLMPRVGPYGLASGDGGDVMAADSAEGGGEGGARAAEPPVAAAPDGEVAADAPYQGDPKRQEQPDHSTTNNHEAAADEPDLVKTDGTRVVSVADGVLRVVDVASRKQTAVVPLVDMYASQLMLAGDRALVVTSTGIATDGIVPAPRIREKPGQPIPDTPIPDTPIQETPIPDEPAPTDTFQYGSQLVLVDLTGAGAVLGKLSIDGAYLDARQVGSVARVVVSSQPRLNFTYPQYNEDPAAALSHNQSAVEDSTIADWLPRYQLSTGGATSGGQLTGCGSVSHPADYTATSMLTVLTFDLGAALGTGDPVTIVADGNTVYGTGSSLYVADDHLMHGMTDAPVAGGQRTELYQFEIAGAAKPRYVASGAVEGHLLNQYSLSEYQGNLRVATTLTSQSASQSMITVLTRKDDKLAEVGRVDGLGVGERIYAVRYFGDTGYVVTFRETDPLYTVDLSDPAAPKVTGELKIPGYSAYLHPAGDGRLIGVGQEATESGQRMGAQVSLFDTSATGARRVAQYHLEGAWTEVEGDPHAFLYWPDKGLVVLPVSGGGAAGPDGPTEQTTGALVLKLAGDSFQQVGLLTHMSERYGNVPIQPRRAMVIGTELWTVSEAGMLVSDLDSLGQLAWLPFT